MFFLLLFFTLLINYFRLMSLSLAAASLIGGSIGAGANIFSSYMQNRNERKMLDRQNAYNIDMWNMNNAYNDPSAQMERLKKAGLNPNLIYGTGHVATGNSSSAPQQTAFISNALGESVRGFGSSVMQALDNYINFKQREQQLESSKISNEIMEEQKKKIAAETKIIEHDAEVIAGKGGVSSKSKYSDLYNIGRKVWDWTTSFFRKEKK